MGRSKLAKILTTPIPAITPPNWKEGLSSGSTMLNLACSGKSHVAFLKGHYYLVVGDSQSGKTFFALTCLAEANMNSYFDEYRFIYDNAEDGALMDVAKFFGKSTSERIEPPRIENGKAVFSKTVQDFYYHLDDAGKEGKPFIYILDSMDALSSQEEAEKFQENKNLTRKGKETKGSYGDGKAKINSSNLRVANNMLTDTQSILIVINQSRDNVAAFSFEKKTRSGGHAQKFYANLEIWTSIKNPIKRRVKGKEREIGSNVKVKVKKNRLCGRKSDIEIPIYFSAGFDELGSCVNFLVEEGHWKEGKEGVNATEFEVILEAENLIKWIEENNKEKALRDIVSEVWAEIEEGCKVERKNRYE